MSIWITKRQVHCRSLPFTEISVNISPTWQTNTFFNLVRLDSSNVLHTSVLYCLGMCIVYLILFKTVVALTWPVLSRGWVMVFLEGNYSCLRPVWEKYKQEITGWKKPKAENLFFEHERTFVSLSSGRPEGFKSILFEVWKVILYSIDLNLSVQKNWLFICFDVE